MKKSSFEDVKAALKEACEFLRSFTLGRYRFTPKDGMVGIQRVTAQCNRMEKLFGIGSDAGESMRIVASARSRISAAQARLDILHKD